MNDKIIMRNIKDIEQKMEVLKKDAYEYSWENYIIHFFFHRDKILIKVKKGVIYAVIPCSAENRRFVGEFYEDNGMECMEGKFELLSHVKALYSIFFGIWYLFRYRSKTYEQRIVDYLRNMLFWD